MRTHALPLAVLLMSTLAYAEAIPAPVTVTFYAPEQDDTTTSTSSTAAPLAVHTGLVAGARVPLPRNPDGSCMVDVDIHTGGWEQTPDPELDLSTGTLLYHDIRRESRVDRDLTTCEAVVVFSTATDRVRRKRIKRSVPRDLREPADPPPHEPTSNAREFQDGCVRYVFKSYARANLYRLYADGTRVRRAWNRTLMHYADQPSRGVLSLRYHNEFDWADLGWGYWISPQSWFRINRPDDPPNYWLAVHNVVFGGRPNASWVTHARVIARPYGWHWEECWGRPDDEIQGHDQTCTRLHRLLSAYWTC